jgi:hypothetical protein
LNDRSFQGVGALWSGESAPYISSPAWHS